MPHCYAHPTLYSTQQLVVPEKKNTFLMETENLKEEKICIHWGSQVFEN